MCFKGSFCRFKNKKGEKRVSTTILLVITRLQRVILYVLSNLGDDDRCIYTYTISDAKQNIAVIPILYRSDDPIFHKDLK